MATAWGPRYFTLVNTDGKNVSDDAETLLGIVTVGSTTELTDTVQLQALVNVTPGPDATGAVLSLYRGNSDSGEQIVQFTTDFDQTVTGAIALPLLFVDYLGPNVVEQPYALTISLPAASDNSNVPVIVLVATVF